MIAFTVAQLQPCLTAGFILAYAQQVLVEKFNVLSFMRHILPTTATISRHTDIVHISPLPEGKHTGTRYVWVHPQIRPWGHQLPVKCPECLCIRPWESTSKGLVYFFGCQHCNHWMTFSPPPEKYSQLGGAVFRGRWLAVDHLE